MTDPQVFGIIPDWLAGPLIIAAVMGFTAWLTSIYKCIHKQSKAMFRFRRAFVLYLQLEAKQVKKFHNDADYDIQPILDLLKDEEGKI